MFRPMRRKNQALPLQEALALLERGSSGVLAVAGDDGYPYAVPLSYCVNGRTLYFHCACSGHKLDAVRRCDKASFCVIARDEVVPEEYTSRFQSVIAFGRVRVVEEAGEKRAAIQRLAKKYAPEDRPEHRQEVIDGAWTSFCILALDIEHLTGKEGSLLAKERGAAQDSKGSGE